MFLVKSLVSEYPEKWETEVWTMKRVLHEINRDHSEGFTPYDETDWQEGWKEWVSPEYHIMLNIRNYLPLGKENNHVG